MTFDFNTFKNIAKFAYIETSNNNIAFRDAIEIFHYYFEQYENFMGEPHPPIKQQQIRNIMSKMAYIVNDSGYSYETYSFVNAVDGYKNLIDLYFKHDNGFNTDFNINHFFSGRIRELLYYDYCY